MPSDVAIAVNGLSKQYRLGTRQRYRTLRESLTSLFTSPTAFPNSQAERIWALRDVSFEIKQGEVVGVIGRNGAGKSTLLKILAQITEPTTGCADIHGRVGSLLEVGTGFHPELTGRENIFLNGAILGMRKHEITRKFDEIVAFAEVEKFIDTPVKHYSSGMQMRLAFAVAAHLEPEILLVDEVLAVGDAAFQKKCLGKMGDVAKQGRTILFVSHNMGAVAQLCERAILLCNGQIIADGAASNTITTYLQSTSNRQASVTFPDDPQADVVIHGLSLRNENGGLIETHPHTLPFKVEIAYEIKNWPRGSYLCLDVFTDLQHRLLWGCDIVSSEELLRTREPGVYRGSITIPGMVLAPGRYSFSVAVYNPIGHLVALKDRVVALDIVDGGSLLAQLGIRPHAATMIPLQWQTHRQSETVIPQKPNERK